MTMKNSPIDLINTGLTMYYYKKDKKDINYTLLENTEINSFWKNIKKYIDKKDKSLIIINIPINESYIKQIKLSPWEAAVLYISDTYIRLSTEMWDKLLTKGITPIPQRVPSQCFVGNYTSKKSKRWMKISENLSFEKFNKLNNKSIELICGLVETAQKKPDQIIKNVIKDIFEFKSPVCSDHEIKKTLSLSKSEIYRYKKKTGIVSILIRKLFENKKHHIGIVNSDISVIFSVKPTYTKRVMNSYGIKYKSLIRFGKAEAIEIINGSPEIVSWIIGRDTTCDNTIGDLTPTLITKRTLKRRFFGDITTQRTADKTYTKHYKSLKDKYPEIEKLEKAIRIPEEGFEEVIDMLEESKTNFKILD
ncbi:MAG: hypothetical protein KAJ51_02390 [Thermoplasmata archaeon]|nr:hypothetical protein [Thermoplasmata archaeon]